jgi:DNA mismatch repair protein MutS2
MIPGLQPADIKSRLINRSLALLGWDLVRDKLADLTVSDATRLTCKTLLPANDAQTAVTWLEETAEMTALFENPEGFPLHSFENIEPILEEAEQHHLLTARQCLHVLKLLRAVKILRSFLAKRGETSPHLAGIGAWLDPAPELIQELDRCIDEEGEIRENATPELRQALREIVLAKEKLQTLTAKLFASPDFKEAVQDAYHTEREGRWVLPVKSEWRTRMDGIVHDTSGSGATVYMEPTRMVDSNNQLKMARIRVEREKARILSDLAGKIVDHTDTLRKNQRHLCALDLIRARARLAREMNAIRCPLRTNAGVLNLRQARNPELILNGRAVIPNDITWADGIRVVVISGPNTGGKTVTLKTAGLMAVMARSGMFLPVAPNSEIGFFPEVYADIGDELSIQFDLSTFSAHVEKIAGILTHAAPGALVLLDELGISTDPEEGSALAEAILLEMSARGMTTLVSTHYLSVKLLAQTHASFLNACAEFDPETMRPTHRLIFGAPGNSAALATAERLGLPADIIRKSREIYNARATDTEALLQKLNRQLQDLANDRERLEQQLLETRILREEQERTTEKHREELREFNRNKSRRLQEHIREGKQELRRLIEQAQSKNDTASLRQAEKQIRTLGQAPLSEVSPVLDGWDVPPDKLRQGDAVIVDTYGKRGMLLEDPQGKAKVRIRLGNLETTIEKERLRGNAKIRALPDESSSASAKFTVQAETVSAPQLSCNLHGMRYDDAERTLEKFLNQAVVNKAAKVVIRHGRGSGALRNMVRDYLEKFGYGKTFSNGTQEEGGDAVTIVEL